MTPPRPGAAREAVMTFRHELWALRRRFAAAYLVTVTAVGAGLLGPLLVKVMIDWLVTGRRPGLLDAGPAAGWPPDAVAALLGAALVVTGIAGALAESGDGLLMARIRERLALVIRRRVSTHLQTLPPTIRTTHRSGELVLRLVGDVDQLTRFFTKTLPLLVRHVATAILTLGAMLWISPGVGVAAALALPALVLLVRRHGRDISRTSRLKRRRDGEVAALAQEIVRGLPVLQAMGTTGGAAARFDTVSADSLRAGVEAARAATRLERTFELARGVAIAAVTAGGALVVLRGRLTVGELTVIAAYVTQLLKPIDKINDLIEATTRGLVAAERLSGLLAERPAVSDPAHPRTIGLARGRLELDDVWFAYPGPGPSPFVLRGVTASFEPGSFSVVLGRSGAGKSTLFSLFVRLFDPASGTVRLDGHPVPALALADLRAQFAVMTQDLHLFSGSIRETLSGVAAVPEGALWDALARVAMDGFVRRLPHGLDTVLGEDGVNLSGGQRQRISLARALLLYRPVLLLDEPLANVDRESARVILEALASLRIGRTVIAITHETDLAAYADHVYRLDEGRLEPVPEARARAGVAP
ncbi:MAG: ABC transporter ATP-binding protein [Vicinamibacterales bacterium]